MKVFGVLGPSSIIIQLFFSLLLIITAYYLCVAAQVSITANGHALAIHADPPTLVVARRSIHNLCSHISICKYKYKSRDVKDRNLFGVAIIEPLPFGHAVKFALARSFQIWDPVVVLSLKKLLVVLSTLFLPAKNNMKQIYLPILTFTFHLVIIFRLMSDLKSLAPLGQG